jgi:hypothetical protein
VKERLAGLTMKERKLRGQPGLSKVFKSLMTIKEFQAEMLKGSQELRRALRAL